MNLNKLMSQVEVRDDALLANLERKQEEDDEAYQAAFAQINQGDVLEAVDKALIRCGKEMMKAVWEKDAEAFCKPIWAQIEKQIADYELAAREHREPVFY